MTTLELSARLIPEPMTFFSKAARVSKTVVSRAEDSLVASFPLISQMAMILAQSLQPGYNPLRDTISSMVWGPFGWLQTANFLLFGGLVIFLVRRLGALIANGHWLKTGSILLYLVGAGFVILAICPAQGPGEPKTIQATIHGITVDFIAFLFPIACFLLALGLRNEQHMGFIASYTIVTGTLGLGFIVLGVFLMVAGAHWFGMFERVLLLNGFVWLEIVGLSCMGQDSVVQVNLANMV